MNNGIVQLHKCVANGELTVSVLEQVLKGASTAKECEVLDFKRQLPDTDLEYAKTVRDMVALHNSYGGFLVFGVEEIEKDRKFSVVGTDGQDIDLAKLRDQARSFLGGDLRFGSQTIMLDNRQLQTLFVAKRTMGESPVRFAKHGPETSKSKLCFKRNDVVFRRIDSNAVASCADDFDFLFSVRKPPSIDLSYRDLQDEAPLDHNLPDRSHVCSRFIGRNDSLGDLWTWLGDRFSRVRLIAGEGGLGKTSLAYRFAEEVASRRVKPFEQIVWLTAKEHQFIAADDTHRETGRTDFHDAISLFQAIALAHGCLEADFDGLDQKELMQLASESCQAMPSFIVVDDVDSLNPADQLRTLEFGMRTPQTSKMLLTTRVNFSYSPDNVLKLNGLCDSEFNEYVKILRDRYKLSEIKSSKLDYLRDVTGGSPLFVDSLLRLERRGLTLELAISQWKGEKGLEARKAALEREVMHLSKAAKRVLYVVSLLKSVSYVELSQLLKYTDQTLGDAIQELAGLFLISAPAIAREARYTIDPNTGSLVISIVTDLGIDHAALVAATKQSRLDAIGLGLQRRQSIVGQAIMQGLAKLKDLDPKGALAAVESAAKTLSKPHPDLLLAVGRFNMKLRPPNLDAASKAFDEAYDLGQRKKLLFDLWFEAEYGRADIDAALEVATKAIGNHLGDEAVWYERRAQTRVARAHRARSSSSVDAAIRELDAAVLDLRQAKRASATPLQTRYLEQMLNEAEQLRRQLHI